MLDLTPPPPPTAEQARLLHRRFVQSVQIVSVFIGLLWLLLWALDQQHVDVSQFGIYPGRPSSWLGLVTAPLVHGGVEHLLANSFGLMILGVLTLYRYPQSAPIAIPLIWLLSGVGTWLIGRPSYHIGASGLSHGLMFFVFVSGLIRRDRTSIAAAMLSFMFFGGMLHSILPQEEGVSFEYHLSGALAGVLCAVLLRRRDPAPARRKYSWELEAERDAEREARAGDSELDLPRPEQVPVLWQRPDTEAARGQVLPFPERRPAASALPSVRIDPGDDPPPTRH
jgi:membrane associated rhomboid family serine protease